jgi:cytochrome c biogenesis protein CcdA/glutaredoxin
MALALLLCISSSYALNLDFYYGLGCSHCAATSQTFDQLAGEYQLDIEKHEVYYDAVERSGFMMQYEKFGYDINMGGVPTTVIDGKTMIIGEMDETQWRSLFEACEDGRCPEGVFSYNNLVIPDEMESNETITPPPNDTSVSLTDPIEEKNGMAAITLSVIIGAAIVDSVNPCTIAVMVLLIGAIIYSRGRKEALVSGLLFSIIIFIMYMLYGLGIMKAVTAFGLSTLFYTVVTMGALLLAIMEFNAYFRYKPGFFAVEMPMFLRPHAKKITQNATSPLGVSVAAVLCSILLIPCSSGPYLVVLGMIAKSATLQSLLYLLLYNFFFVLPMVIITFAIYVGKTTVEKIQDAKDKHIKHIHLFSGIILLILFIIMLGQLLETL